MRRQCSVRCGFVVAALSAFLVASAQPYQLLISEAFPGSSTDQSIWKGVRKFHFSGSGGAVGERAGIGKQDLADAIGLCVAGTKVFVSNRHGNSGPGTISRFVYSTSTDAFTKEATISDGIMSGPHGLALRPNGDLLVGNVSNGVSRFANALNSASSLGVILPGTQTRGVFVDPTDNYVYIAQGINDILTRYRISDGASHNFNIANGSGMHFGGWMGSDLVLAAYGSGRVVKISFDANGAPTATTTLVQLPQSICTALSPDQKEMYVGNHNTGLISRYMYDTITQSWLPNGSFQSGTSCGDMRILPLVPTTVTISGSVSFQDFPPGPNGQKASVTFFYEGRPQETINNVSIASNGTFSVQTSRRGLTSVGVKGTHWLRATANVTITDAGGTIAPISMPNGDCDGNNIVGTDDYLIINDSFDKSIGDVGFDARGDLDGSGYVGTDDYLILNKNFDDSGA